MEALSKSSFPHFLLQNLGRLPGRSCGSGIMRNFWVSFLPSFSSSHPTGLWCLKGVESTLVEIGRLSSLVMAILGKGKAKTVCTEWCANNLNFIQVRCGELLEVTHFWQLTVPGKDKRKDKKRAFCRNSGHFETKPLLFLILKGKRMGMVIF